MSSRPAGGWPVSPQLAAELDALVAEGCEVDISEGPLDRGSETSPRGGMARCVLRCTQATITVVRTTTEEAVRAALAKLRVRRGR